MRIILKSGDRNEEVVLLQRALNELGGFSLFTDGDFGPGTCKALTGWQKKNGYVPDGIYDSEIQHNLSDLIENKYIRLSMVDQYADAIDVESAFLRAVVSVESQGTGFTPNGLCTILFERHIFYKQVVNKFGKKRADDWSARYPNICYSSRSQSAYYGGSREWDRMDAAKNLDPECALLSASYGMFQIMGFNFGICGYDNVGAYVADMVESEKYHVGAVSMFIRNQRGLLNAAKSLNFNEFARLYNGSAYATHNYHGRLKTAYNNNLNLVNR